MEEEGVFSRGYDPPPLPVPLPFAPCPEMVETHSYPLPSGHSKCHSSAPSYGSWGPRMDGLGHHLPHSPSSLRECAAGCSPRLQDAPCVLSPSSALYLQEVSQSRISSCCPLRHSPGTTSSLCKNKHDGKDFHRLSTSSSTLNFSIT